MIRVRFPRAIAQAAVGVGIFLVGAARAADHAEAPGTRADPAADIADVYAWHDTANNTLVTIVTFAGLALPGASGDGTFDAGVLYTVNIDNDGDFTPDVQVHASFAQDDSGRWGIRVENLPGAPGTVTGRVNKKITVADNVRVFGGLRDDPFFFDLEGFRNTLMTGTLSFDSNRDTFAGLNVTAIALEMDLAAALDGGSTLRVWATTSR